MIRMPACYLCKHFIGEELIREAQNPEEIDEYKRTCKAFPEGIPKEYFRLSPGQEKCSGGFGFEPDPRYKHQ